MVDYFYGFMAPSTGMLKYCDIVPYESGFVLLFPGANSRSVEPLVTSNKLFHTLDDSREWSKMLGIGTVSYTHLDVYKRQHNDCDSEEADK